MRSGITRIAEFPQTPIIIVMTAGLIARALAFSADQPRTLSLSQCLEIARNHNTTMRIAERNIRINELAVRELHATGLPQVKVGVGASDAPHGSVLGYDPAITDGGQLSGQLIVQQPIFDPGRKIENRRLSLERSRLSLARLASLRDLEAAVRLSFVEALGAQEETDLQKDNLRQSADYLALVTAMKAAGNASPADVLKTQAQFDSDGLVLDNAVENETLARLALAQAMGIPGDTTIRAAGTVNDLPVTIPNEDSMGNTGDFPGKPLDLRIADLEAREGDLDVDLAKSERLPDVSLAADAGLLTSADNLRAGPGGRLPFVGASAGVSAVMPLFSWGAIRIRADQRALAALSLRDSAQALGRSIASQRHILAERIRSAFTNRSTLAEMLKLFGDSFLLTRSTFAGGAGTASEVLLAHRQLADARLMVLHNEINLRLFQIQLTRLSGR